MTAQKVSKGRVYRFSLIATDEDGAPIDLTGYSLKMELREKLGSPVLATVDNGANGGITITANQADFTISSVKTALLPSTQIKTDVKAVPPGPGEPFTLAELLFSVEDVYTQ